MEKLYEEILSSTTRQNALECIKEIIIINSGLKRLILKLYQMGVPLSKMGFNTEFERMLQEENVKITDFTGQIPITPVFDIKTNAVRLFHDDFDMDVSNMEMLQLLEKILSPVNIKD